MKHCLPQQQTRKIHVCLILLQALVVHHRPWHGFVERLLVKGLEHHEIILCNLLEVILPQQAALAHGGDNSLAIHEEAEEHDGQLLVLTEVCIGMRKVAAVDVSLAELQECLAHHIAVRLPAASPLLGELFQFIVVSHTAQELIAKELTVGSLFGIGGAELAAPFLYDHFGYLIHLGHQRHLQHSKFVEPAHMVLKIPACLYGILVLHLAGVYLLKHFAS